MRPRVFPAEDVERVGGQLGVGVASMRPRVFPAEDVARIEGEHASLGASMRPRVFPAEDARRRPCTPPSSRFNEAAGIPRGRHSYDGNAPGRSHRFNEAAGIPRGRRSRSSRSGPSSARFNEAAGIPRGRLPAAGGERLHGRGFNEAAGIPRGRRLVVNVDGERGEASMRPRVFPAEDRVSTVTEIRGKVNVSRFSSVSEEAEDTFPGATEF